MSSAVPWGNRLVLELAPQDSVGSVASLDPGGFWQAGSAASSLPPLEFPLSWSSAAADHAAVHWRPDGASWLSGNPTCGTRQASNQAVTLARQAHLAQRAALFAGAAAVREALYGYPDESSRHSFAAGQLVSGRDADFAPAFALALSRNSSSALAIVTRLEKQYPEDTCVRFSYSPTLRALLAMIKAALQNPSNS